MLAVTMSFGVSASDPGLLETDHVVAVADKRSIRPRWPRNRVRDCGSQPTMAARRTAAHGVAELPGVGEAYLRAPRKQCSLASDGSGVVRASGASRRGSSPGPDGKSVTVLGEYRVDSAVGPRWLGSVRVKRGGDFVDVAVESRPE